MAFQSEQDWQLTKKTVLERNSYMFMNPLMSDITLTYGDSKGKYFSAHKYVLATSSPVFYRMFYGALAETNSVVRLKDADEESLEEFLRFLYTDQCALTPEITVNVLYLAEKYMIPSLIDRCIKALQDYMKPANVFTVLALALHFEQSELEKKCWEMIDDEASEAVTSDGFSNINQNILIHLLKRETLKIKEIELFLAVLKWSESECSKKGLEVTGMNRRMVLGDALYQIRFLSISEKDFEQYVASQFGLLTVEEIFSIYQTFNGIDVPSLKWKLLPQRQMELLRCRRFAGLCTGKFRYAGSSDSLSFSVNKPATFYGVCLFGDENCSEYDVTLEVRSANVSGIFTTELKSKSPEIYGYDVILSTPISFDKNEVVTMVATIQGPSSYRGQHGVASVEVGGATVTFTNSSQLSNWTNVEQGQFYEIILSF